MAMLPDIIIALTKELKYFFLDKNGTCILDTELSDDITASFPLCILDVSDAPDSARLPGNGVTRMEWNFSLRIYAFEPNAYNSEELNYSANLLQIIDDIRNFFENESWATQEMNDLLTNYGLRITYEGTTKAENIQIGEKLCMGFRHHFSSIAIDQNTEHDTYMDITADGENTGEIDFEMPGTDNTPVPGTPVADAATNIQSDGFTANLEAVSGVKGYIIDVATDIDFTSFVEGYENKDIGNNLSFVASGLDPETDYYYRFRSYSDVNVSENSNTISTTTITALTDIREQIQSL
jgi:hypothetical protein